MGERGRPKFCIFPEYKWCGPGCSGPGEPINEVDAACMKHDLCYERYGPSCHCDHQFLSEIKPHVNLANKEGRDALLFYHYMKLQTGIKCGHDRRNIRKPRSSGIRWI
ncbi:phospholipase [Rossellomorea aquimaris]|uniref:phospholipase n=1 Tax=Rossellomorea aquimaris TaxID=189382 RepID=UPI001CD38B82|nr:phospholipase [Rossellomorea aquimaris]MCA1055997.1 phospholipase [Rossellomorea aquimaris]